MSFGKIEFKLRVCPKRIALFFLVFFSRGANQQLADTKLSICSIVLQTDSHPDFWEHFLDSLLIIV